MGSHVASEFQGYGKSWGGNNVATLTARDMDGGLLTSKRRISIVPAATSTVGGAMDSVRIGLM